MRQLPISVAMCTYNGARFLPEQLESIAAQTRLPDELVICDDRSTDKSVEIIKAFTCRAPFAVRLEINESNRGATKNFEKAIGLCQGDIIALADQDDVWRAQKLERISDTFLHFDQTVAVCSDAELIDQESRSCEKRIWDSSFFDLDEQKRFANGEALHVLLKHPVVTGATMAFRKRFCALLLPIPANHIHDYWISVLLAACGDFQTISDALIQYRQHGDQQVGPGPGILNLWEQTEIAWNTSRRRYLSEIEGLRQIGERLNARSVQFPCREFAIKLVTEKIEHFNARARFSQPRLLQLPMLFREVTSRRYWLYSAGWRSIAKDLFL